MTWWNTQTQSRQTSVIAGREIDVLPADISSNQGSLGASSPNTSSTTNAITATQNDVSKMQPKAASGDHESDVSASDQNSASGEGWIWKWIALLSALSWMITVILWWNVSRKNMGKPSQPNANKAETHKNKLKTLRKALKQACESNNGKQVVEILPQWAALHFEDENIRHLAQVHGHSQALDDALQALNQSLYAANTDKAWSGQILWDVVNGLQPTSHNKAKQQASKLRGLYD